MCIIFVAINQHPRYPVIICANRDEFHERPTQPMAFWQKEQIWAGKDLKAGGTWLALSEKMGFSALTNYRIPSQFSENKRSRGHIVLNALNNASNEFLNSLKGSHHHYNDFNILFGELDQLNYFESYTGHQQTLCDGLYAICNGSINADWPKMVLGRTLIADLLENHSSIEHQQLLSIMTNTEQAEERDLPITGIPLAWEAMLSAIFIQSPDYGTRSTTIVTKDHLQNIALTEVNYNVDGMVTQTIREDFKKHIFSKTQCQLSPSSP